MERRAGAAAEGRRALQALHLRGTVENLRQEVGQLLLKLGYKDNQGGLGSEVKEAPLCPRRQQLK